jgi:hypothetical protein
MANLKNEYLVNVVKVVFSIKWLTIFIYCLICKNNAWLGIYVDWHQIFRGSKFLLNAQWNDSVLYPIFNPTHLHYKIHCQVILANPSCNQTAINSIAINLFETHFSFFKFKPISSASSCKLMVQSYYDNDFLGPFNF